MNHEPLLGLPFPRLLHSKMVAMREVGLSRISCLGGLTNPAQAPYWPNPAIIRAAHDSGIKVASVNKGVVLLSGKTKSVATQLEAIQVADAVKGVRRVSSEVQLDQ